MELHRRQFGKLVVRGLSTAGRDADTQIDAHLSTLGEGTVQPRELRRQRLSWLEFALNPFPELFAMPPGGVRSKVKDALLRKRLADDQIAIVYEYLTSTEYDAPGGVFGMASYGGRVNSVAPDATASAARDAILDTACNVGWLDEQDTAKNLAWVRAFYRALFAETGGVPVPGDALAGALINHPDTDVLDPELNTSGVPWTTLYYRDNYPRLQRVKAQWDPRNIFRHALSVSA
jgi:aclacinomycin oxidase